MIQNEIVTHSLFKKLLQDHKIFVYTERWRTIPRLLYRGATIVSL